MVFYWNSASEPASDHDIRMYISRRGRGDVWMDGWMEGE